MLNLPLKATEKEMFVADAIKKTLASYGVRLSIEATVNCARAAIAAHVGQQLDLRALVAEAAAETAETAEDSRDEMCRDPNCIKLGNQCSVDGGRRSCWPRETTLDV